MNFPGGGIGGAAGASIPGVPAAGARPGAPPGFDPNDPNVKWVCCPSFATKSGLLADGETTWQLTNAMESCYAKTVMSGVAGFALGGLFGMFMASVGFTHPVPSVLSREEKECGNRWDGSLTLP